MPFTPPSEGELYPTFVALKLTVKRQAGSEGYALFTAQIKKTRIIMLDVKG